MRMTQSTWPENDHSPPLLVPMRQHSGNSGFQDVFHCWGSKILKQLWVFLPHLKMGKEKIVCSVIFKLFGSQKAQQECIICPNMKIWKRVYRVHYNCWNPFKDLIYTLYRTFHCKVQYSFKKILCWY